MAETAGGDERTAVSTSEEQTVGTRQAEAAAGVEAAADAAGKMGGVAAAPPGVSKAEPAAPEGTMAEVRTAAAAATATAAAADVETDEMEAPAGAAAGREALEACEARLRRDRRQKEGAAAVD